jgi:hypothetical protein
MKLYEIAYPDENNNDVVEILTEEEILATYWDYWKARMESIGLNHLITRERCIEDWCVIHWATTTHVPL